MEQTKKVKLAHIKAESKVFRRLKGKLPNRAISRNNCVKLRSHSNCPSQPTSVAQGWNYMWGWFTRITKRVSNEGFVWVSLGCAAWLCSQPGLLVKRWEENRKGNTKKGFLQEFVCKKEQKCVCLGGAGRNQRGQSRQRTTYANKTLRSETLCPWVLCI